MKRFCLLIAMTGMLVACSEDDPATEVKGVACVEDFEQGNAEAGGYAYGYASDNLQFEYFVNEEYGYWGGFAHSRLFNTEDGSYANQYSVYNDAAASGDGYLVYYYDSYNEPCDIVCLSGANYSFASVRLNLTTYVHSSITVEESNDFARVFTDGDYLKVVFTELLAADAEGDSVECYVVDYRDGKQFMATQWEEFDLSGLEGQLWGLRVRIETTDMGEWGANTPLYIAIDELSYTIE